MMTRIFFVVEVDNDFRGDMAEAAIWLESRLDYNNSKFRSRVTAYRSLEDLNFDAADKEGAFKPITGMMEG